MQNLNIVMLVGSGAGKTIYLASLFRKLAIQGTKRYNSFSLEVDTIDQRILNDIFASVTSLNQSWPPGTRSIKDWKFKCYVKNAQGKKYEVCSFNYVDYAGGTLSDVLNDEQGKIALRQLDQRIEEANIVLGLLDGKKIVDFMRDKPSSIDWINRDLTNIIHFMNRGSVPIHFIISKWDYVEEIGRFSPAQIMEKLLQIPEVNALVDSKRVRLIPISSVGKGFARFETMPNGEVRMVKTGKLFFQPYQVEIPLAYVLIDSVQNAAEKLDERIKKMNAVAKFFFYLYLFIVNPIVELFTPPGTKVLSTRVANMINDATFVTQYRKSLADIQSEKAAFDHIISCFKYIIEEFEDTGNSLMRKKRQ